MTKPIKSTDISSQAPNLRARFLRQFGRDEDGGIIVLTLLLLIMMLVMGGMAVDFMRYESRRALLQSVSDRAVLAAAELDQGVDPSTVVVEYFEKAGFGGAIIGTPIVNNESGSRSVRVDSKLDINTFYLRFVGIDQLSAPATSAAIEGTGNIEISLILDISGSMGNSVQRTDNTWTTKMVLLKEAASSFVDTLLIPDYEDEISISLVAYSQHVNVGDGLFNALNVESDTILDDEYNTEFVFDPETLDADSEGKEYYTNPSRCVDFDDDEYDTTTFDTLRQYKQVELFQHYYGTQSSINYPLCPQEEHQGIIPLSQNATVLKAAINKYEPTTFTSIHLGMKWGVSLLDPSMRDLLEDVPDVDPAFAGSRPSDYGSNSVAVNTIKYVILMTDGENVSGRRIKPEYYNDFHWRTIWSQYPINYWRSYQWHPDIYSHPTNEVPTVAGATEYRSTATEQDGWLQSMCGAARDQNIVVFTIAMGATTHGEDEMKECADDPDRYFATQGAEIVQIFEAIASQIKDLRLSL